MKKMGDMKAINIILWIVAVLLCFVTIVIGIMGYLSYGFRGLDNEYVSSNALTDKDNDDNLMIGNSISQGILLSSSTTGTDNKITATVSGPEGINKNLIWELSWTVDNEWTNGKNVKDYIELIIAPDTQSAVVNNKKPFNATIKIKVKSVTRESVFATCNIDYVKRINTLKNTSKDEYIAVSLENDYVTSGVSPVIDIQYTEGTISPDYSYMFVITYSDEMLKNISDTLFNNGFDVTIDTTLIKPIQKDKNYKLSFNIVEDLIPGVNDRKAINIVNDLFIEQKGNLNWYCDVALKVFLKHDDKTYFKNTYDVQRYKFDPRNLTKLCAQSVSLDKNQIIF